MEELSKLKGLDTSRLSDKLKGQVSTAISTYGDSTDLLKEEKDAILVIYTRCLDYIKKDDERIVKEQEENEIKAKKEQEENELKEKKDQEENEKKQAVESVNFEHESFYKENKSKLPSSLSKKINGVNLLVGKFKKNPNEKTKNTALTSSKQLVVAMKKYMEKNSDEVKKKQEDESKREREKKILEDKKLSYEEKKKKLLEESTATRNKQQQKKQEAKESMEKAEKEVKDRNGAYNNPFLKGIFGI